MQTKEIRKEVKKCCKCKERKPFSDFYKNKSRKDGYGNWCKDCSRVYHGGYYENNSEYIKEVRRDHYKNNPEHFKNLRKNNSEYYTQWRKDNPECFKAASRKYFKKNPEKYKAIILSQRVPCPKGMQKHHWSYEEKNAKDIIICTPEQHSLFHRLHTYDQERMAFRNGKGVLMSKENTIGFLNI